MNLQVRPAKGLRGQVAVPGDKSISHRAVLLAAVARGTSEVEHFLPGGDCEASLQAVQQLGVTVERPAPACLRLHSKGAAAWQEPTMPVDCVNSGTTIRLLTGLLAGPPLFSVLTGSAQLRHRPMDRVAVPLRSMGATILGRQAGRYAPLAIRGGKLHGQHYTMPVASAQVKSALILAGLFAAGETEVIQPGPARDHTERMLSALGAPLQVDGNSVRVHTMTKPLAPLRIDVPGDFSSAAFWLVAATIVPQSELILTNVGINATRIGLLDILRRAGARVDLIDAQESGGEPVADLRVHSADLSGMTVAGTDVVRMIDEFPILAVAATQAHGVTEVCDAAELRVKETDRIAVMAAELRKMGAEVVEQPDGFHIAGPVHLQGTQLDSHGDHRIGMALAVAALTAQGDSVIQNADCIGDSYPGFVETLLALTA